MRRVIGRKRQVSCFVASSQKPKVKKEKSSHSEAFEIQPEIVWVNVKCAVLGGNTVEQFSVANE